ncbi:MAG: NAD(P)/FAD-dependent oxidoreductase [Chitinophagales bacterium]
MDADIIIIGAGIAGLTAAQQLATAGKRVLILEGRPRPGGRINTTHNTAFTQPVELGAEFIHGKLENTFKLLKRYKIATTKIGGSFWLWEQGMFKYEGDFIEHARLLDKPLKNLKSDKTVEAFLKTLPRDERHTQLKESVRRFVEGYDAADPAKASALAFRREWQEQEDAQFRIEGGYGALVNALAADCRKLGVRILTDHAVKKLKWKKGLVEVSMAGTQKFAAAKCIITVPIGVLQLPAHHPDAILFSPALPEKTKAANNIGYGPVIKVLLEFKSAFWKQHKVHAGWGRNLKKLGFLFSDTGLPTWWTQHPSSLPLLTGWIGGPSAAKLQHLSNEELLVEALTTLSVIFNRPIAALRANLAACEIANWGNDPFAHGAYSYTIAKQQQARRQLAAPVSGTLYFAGEACCTGTEAGTVEGAIISANRVVKLLLK